MPKLLAMLLCVLSFLIYPQDGGACLPTDLLGKSLGRTAATSTFSAEVLLCLDKDAKNAVGLLINELEVVNLRKIRWDTDSIMAEKGQHVLWCLRLLHHLTGLNFKASTRYRFKKEGENRKYWLCFNTGNPHLVAFFGEWPSRGVDYIAHRMRSVKSFVHGKHGIESIKQTSRSE
jgi:hypothetical protein